MRLRYPANNNRQLAVRAQQFAANLFMLCQANYSRRGFYKLYLARKDTFQMTVTFVPVQHSSSSIEIICWNPVPYVDSDRSICFSTAGQRQTETDWFSYQAHMRLRDGKLRLYGAIEMTHQDLRTLDSKTLRYRINSRGRAEVLPALPFERDTAQ